MGRRKRDRIRMKDYIDSEVHGVEGKAKMRASHVHDALIVAKSELDRRLNDRNATRDSLVKIGIGATVGYLIFRLTRI